MFTRLLFIFWNAVRSLIEAAIQASCVWSVVDFFSPISWTSIFWIFAVIQGLVFLAIIFGRLPQMATPFVKASTFIHAPVVALSLLQAVLSAIIPAILGVVVINLISPWTHKSTDWIHPSVFFASLFFILYHHHNRQKAFEVWAASPPVDPQKFFREGVEQQKSQAASFSEEHLSPDLPKWQRDEITEHRRLRQKTNDPSKIIWTRTAKGTAVTESARYWALVTRSSRDQFDFFVYFKNSGYIACSWFDYETEQPAMHAAVDFMRDGKDPRDSV